MKDRSAKRRRMVRLLVALGLTATLGGCIVVPVGGYRRPPRYYYY